MGRAIIIYGPSGSGKSRSLKNFDAEEIQIINVLGKDLPFRNRFKHVLKTSEYDDIKKYIRTAIEVSSIRTFVIDDCGYLMAGKFLDQAADKDKKGSQVFDFYNEIAHEFWDLRNFIVDELPENANVYLLMHEDRADDGEVRVATIGKQLSEKTRIWEWVTVALRCASENGRHFFITQSNGLDITKSPEEMFPSLIIENDLKAVDTTIREYFNN